MPDGPISLDPSRERSAYTPESATERAHAPARLGRYRPLSRRRKYR